MSVAVQAEPVSAVRSLTPIIRDECRVTDRTRAIPGTVVDALREAGVFRLLAPRALGGAESDPLTFLRVVEEVSYADGSAGWCTMIGGCYAAAATRPSVACSRPRARGRSSAIRRRSRPGRSGRTRVRLTPSRAATGSAGAGRSAAGRATPPGTSQAPWSRIRSTAVCETLGPRCSTSARRSSTSSLPAGWRSRATPEGASGGWITAANGDAANAAILATRRDPQPSHRRSPQASA